MAELTPQPGAEPAACPPPRRLSTLAVLSVPLGLAGFCIPGAGLLGLASACAAVARIHRRKPELEGLGLAISGAVVSALSTLTLFLLAVGVLVAILAQSRFSADRQSPWVRSGAVGGMMYPGPPADEYYFDLGTGRLFVAPGGAFPAGMATPTGPDLGVRAYVFGCGDCAAANRFVGYLETYGELPAAPDTHTQPAPGASIAPAGMAPPEAEAPPPAAVPLPDRLVRTVEEDQWVLGDSDAGRRITAIDPARCPPGKPLRPCEPTDALFDDALSGAAAPGATQPGGAAEP